MTASTIAITDIPQLTWYDPAGTEFPLSLPGWATNRWLASAGVSGLGIAPVSIATDPMPRGGTQVRHVQPQPRIITLPIFIEGDEHADFLTRWRTLAHAFATTRLHGPGRLQLARPDGTIREIPAYYQDGWDVNTGAPANTDLVVLTLYCPDPFWRSTTPTLITRTYSSGGTSFLSPFPTVSSSQTLGATIATNPGSVEAWPTWRITGPGGSLTATNNTTGETFVVDISAFRGSALLAGETVTIVTEPPSVTGPDDTNWTGALEWPGSVLWGLQPGDNDVTFVMSGSGSGTVVEAEFYPRYETA
jgi:hypothetical protein